MGGLRVFFKKKKRTSNTKELSHDNRELSEIVEKKSKKEKKLDNVSEELIAKAIKDLLTKE